LKSLEKSRVHWKTEGVSNYCQIAVINVLYFNTKYLHAIGPNRIT